MVDQADQGDADEEEGQHKQAPPQQRTGPQIPGYRCAGVGALEELADLVGGLLGGLGRVADGLLGPAPVPIPIPVEDEREQAPEQPPVGNDPYKYPGTY